MLLFHFVAVAVIVIVGSMFCAIVGILWQARRFSIVTVKEYCFIYVSENLRKSNNLAYRLFINNKTGKIKFFLFF